MGNVIGVRSGEGTNSVVGCPHGLRLASWSPHVDDEGYLRFVLSVVVDQTILGQRVLIVHQKR